MVEFGIRGDDVEDRGSRRLEVMEKRMKSASSGSSREGEGEGDARERNSPNPLP